MEVARECVNMFYTLVNLLELNYNILKYFDCLAKVTPDDVKARLSVFERKNAVLSVVNPVKKAEA